MNQRGFSLRAPSRLALVSVLALGMVPTTAFAQDSDGAEELRPDDSVIIVTATRRAENLQEIPLAVTAVGTEALDRQGITDITGLSSISASFNTNSSDTETGGTTIRIRGVGTTGNNVGLESAVGVFLDGVYLSRPGAALGELVDVERLELLRGPQGTLFGRNTTAGALNITTKKPDLNEVEGFANASYGNFNLFSLQGGVSLPVVQDTLGVRFTGAYRQRDGVLTQGPVGNRTDVNDVDRYSLRGQVYWEPSADISVRLIADFSSSDAACCDAVVLSDNPAFRGANFASLGLPADGGVPDEFLGVQAQENRTASSSSIWRNGFDNLGFSGELNWDIGDSATLTYIGSYRDFDSFTSRSTDYVDLAVFSVGEGDSIFDGGGPNTQEIETITHELRLQGEAFNDRLNWLIGAFYSDEQISTGRGILGLGADYQQYIGAFLGGGGGALGPAPILPLTGGAGFTGAFADNAVSQDAESWSVFTHNSLELTDTLTATIGLRYSNDKKQGAFEQIAASNAGCEGSVDTILNSPSPVLAGTARAVLGLTCFVFATPADLDAAFDSAPGAGDALPLPRTFGNGAQGGIFDEFTDDELIYTGKLAWQPTPDINTYVSFTHGYKSGGFNLDASASVLGADPRFRSETIDAYELGVKATVFDGSGTLNIAFFHQDITDFQVLEFTGVRFQTFNVPSAKSTGAELEFQAELSDQFSTNIGMTYTDARYPSDCVGDDFSNPNANALCGNDLTNAPNFVGNFGLVFEDTINDAGWSVQASGNLNYSSSRRTSTQATELVAPFTPLLFDIQEDYFKVNARIGISTPDDRFTFEIWGNNITDEQTRNVTFNTPLRGASRSAFLEAPRTYGATIRTQF